MNSINDLKEKDITTIWNEIVDKLLDVDLWLNILYITFQIIVIWAAASILVKLSWKVINRFLSEKEGLKSPIKFDRRRAKTLGILVHNILKYSIYFLAILMILGKLDFDLGPLLAGAGVVGLAIGFGAQNLVKDIISGFFIIFEDQFGVGDYITIGSYTGTVEEIGLRITKIRKWTGELHIIPNGNINEVTNFSNSNSVAVIDVGVAYEENIGHVVDVLKNVLEKASHDIKEITKTPEVLGVQDLGQSEVVIRIIAETDQMQHFAVSRKLKEIIKESFDKEGIEIPYPRLVTYKRS